MRTTILALVAAAMLAAGAFRLRSFLRTRSAGSGHLALAVTCGGLAILLNAPDAYRWVDSVVLPRANSSALASHILSIVGLAAAVEMVSELVDQPRVITRRTRLITQAMIILAMATIFLRVTPAHDDALFFEHYKTDANLAPYWYVFFGAVLTQLTYISFLTLRFAEQRDLWLQRGLRCIGTGAALAALFIASRVLEVNVHGIPPAADDVAVGILVVGNLLIAAGVLLPQVGLVLQRRLNRDRLLPLWGKVTAEYSYVRATHRKPSLYRLVIEVQDAVAEARTQQRIDAPTLVALNALEPRPAAEFDTTVDELLGITSRLDQGSAVRPGQGSRR